MVLNQAGCLEDPNLNEITSLYIVLERLQKQNRIAWHLEAYSKSKFQTFIKIHNFIKQKVMIKANLDRRKCSLLTKFKAGVFRIHLGTGRDEGTPPDK